MTTIPSPNIWNDPETYELENLAIDPEGLIEHAMREVEDWAGLDVIDVGAGTGFHAERFAGTARSVLAVEPHPPLVERAAARLADVPNARAVVGGAQQLPADDDSFDVHHSRWAYFFGPGCEPGLRELERVMRPGGTSFIVDYDATRSVVGAWFRRAFATADPVTVEQYWFDRGWRRTSVDIRWEFPDRETAEAVVRLEFGRDVLVDRVLSVWTGTTLEDAINVWWRRY